MSVERLSKDWHSPIYAFFKPVPFIDYIDNRRVHVFVCGALHCKGKGKYGQHVRRYLDTGDAKSTSNLRRHAKVCWGTETIDLACETKDVDAARDALAKGPSRDGSLIAVFERIGKKKSITYSHRQHTKTESRAEIVRWVAESMRPFMIVKDRGFQSLMKTGRPDYNIPSPETISRDVKKVFVRCRQRIAKMLQVCTALRISIFRSILTVTHQEYDGALSFATDAWTSPNHKPYVAVTVHFEKGGVAVSMLLDLVDVARSHSGLNLAVAFATILDDFGIADKVSSSVTSSLESTYQRPRSLV